MEKNKIWRTIIKNKKKNLNISVSLNIMLHNYKIYNKKYFFAPKYYCYHKTRVSVILFFFSEEIRKTLIFFSVAFFFPTYTYVHTHTCTMINNNNRKKKTVYFYLLSNFLIYFRFILVTIIFIYVFCFPSSFLMMTPEKKNKKKII